jgi:hypothetical protein
LAAFFVCAFVAPLAAQPKKGSPPPKADKPAAAPAAGTKTSDNKSTGTPKVKNFDFNALDLNGRMRTPQLLYFLERANEELERASLEKRSFIPHIVRSVEEEQL